MKWKESPITLEKRSSIVVGALSNIDAAVQVMLFVVKVPATKDVGSISEMQEIAVVALLTRAFQRRI